MKNKITDLRNHLFAQIERLGDEDLKGEELNAEISRARAIGQIAGQITDTARVEVDYIKVTGGTEGSEFLPRTDAGRLEGGDQ